MYISLTLDIRIYTLYHIGFGAQERDKNQWLEIINKTGFELVKIHDTRCLLNIIELKPRFDQEPEPAESATPEPAADVDGEVPVPAQEL